MPTAKWNHDHNLCNVILPIQKKKQNCKEGKKGRQGKEKESVERGIEEEKREEKKALQGNKMQLNCCCTSEFL